MSAKPRSRRAPASRTPIVSTATTELLPLADVLKTLGVSRSTFYEWIRHGKAPKCIKYPNSKIMVRRSDLDTWLAQQEVHA